MAHLETIDDPDLPFFYNVTQAVGSTGSHYNPMEPSVFYEPNRRDDVMLVQYFLKGIYENATVFQPPAKPPAGKAMVVDGYFGPQTKRWIHHFQIESRKRGNNIATDGVVDRARNGTSASSISKTFYTIVFLNLAFRKARPAAFSDITQDILCPPELKAAIANNGVVAAA